jgi:hypothetical protein
VSNAVRVPEILHLLQHEPHNIYVTDANSLIYRYKYIVISGMGIAVILLCIEGDVTTFYLRRNYNEKNISGDMVWLSFLSPVWMFKKDTSRRKVQAIELRSKLTGTRW